MAGTLENTTDEKICYVQLEPHMMKGTRTVGEIGPKSVGHLAPGQKARTKLLVADDADMAGVDFDGWVIHPETFDCNSSGPRPGGHEGGEGEHGGEEG